MIMTVSPIIWMVFNVSVIALLVVDAFILNPKSKEMTLRRAIAMTGFWILLALLFNLGIYYWFGDQRALEFLTGYVVEQSLSIDNLFVFLLIFSHFKTSAADQRRMLFWGIVSAQVMRAVFIISGVALLNIFSWTMYIFGGILIFTGIKLFFKNDEEVHPENNFFYKSIAKKLPLFWFVFIVIQVTDLIFAVDSIPAVLAITKSSFIAYSSNIFAILGLRSMYFALASFMKVFHYLHYGLAVILIFVGTKMLVEHYYHISVLTTLGFILVALTVTVITSIVCPPKSLQKS
jgi:tellurite resistance protein TerC